MKYANIGISEYGSNAIAGKVVVAAVILPEEHRLDWLNQYSVELATFESLDSRVENVKNSAILSKVVELPSILIDTIGLEKAMNRVIGNIIKDMQTRLCVTSEEMLLLSYNDNCYSSDKFNVITIDRSKGRYDEIDAAEILAKHSYLKHMRKLHNKFPAYGFNENLGLAQEDHLLAIKKNGLCYEHRERTLKKITG